LLSLISEVPLVLRQLFKEIFSFLKEDVVVEELFDVDAIHLILFAIKKCLEEVSNLNFETLLWRVYQMID
jgi:hypothetical protein